MQQLAPETKLERQDVDTGKSWKSLTYHAIAFQARDASGPSNEPLCHIKVHGSTLPDNSTLSVTQPSRQPGPLLYYDLYQRARPLTTRQCSAHSDQISCQQEEQQAECNDMHAVAARINARHAIITQSIIYDQQPPGSQAYA